MPVSNDNQDYGKSDEKNQAEGNQQTPSGETNLTTDDLKGKKVDADVEKETDKPADQ